MPGLRTYNVFISHAWTYDAAYDRVVSLLNAAPFFVWRNHSVPRTRPVVSPGLAVARSRLVSELRDQIRPTHIVLVVAGMYAAHREWIQTELDIATDWNKPIVGLVPWGAARVPTAITIAAREMVRWNTASIVAAIGRHAITPA